MPKIKPFNGIRPNPDYADEVVLDIENLSLEEAKVIRQENPYSYVNMLVPKLDNLFLRGSKDELAFKKINENFEEFLEKGILKRDLKPSIYLYQISRDHLTQTGIWTITSVDDYLNNTIKKHELTRPDRERVLVNYLQQSGIDANPVLIVYQGSDEINSIIQQICQQDPALLFSKENAAHKLWNIDDEVIINRLVQYFKEIPAAYIADGHHRAAAASLLALEHRKLDADYNDDEEYNYFTSVYMSSDQIRILEFNRLIKGLNGLSEQQFIYKLRTNFEITGYDSLVKPEIEHEFGMYLAGKWYTLKVKPEVIILTDPVASLDVSILQDSVFSKLLNISDPRTDPRISFAGGVQPIEELVEKVDSGEFDLLFTLYPTSLKELISVADEGRTMPPKSTWFEPKFQVGLLIHRII